jgi:hypothetical protein
MIFLEQIKFIAEVITSIATALIIMKQLFKLCNPIKNFFKITVPAFFIGYTDINGKRTRFFKGLRLRREQNTAIIKAITTDVEMEDVLVLDKKALLDIISNSSVFHTVHLRKK